ncbi:MAG TPA: tyrosine-type recombinase/integrase, partial [Urbifossiella sp.]
AAIGRRQAGPIFITANGQRYKKSAIREGFEAMLRREKMAWRNPHQMRHSVATAMISAPVPLGDVAKYLGDSVQTVVKTYLHAAGTDPGDALNKIFQK